METGLFACTLAVLLSIELTDPDSEPDGEPESHQLVRWVECLVTGRSEEALGEISGLSTFIVFLP